MKVIVKPISMVASFDSLGDIKPIKFRWKRNQEDVIVKVDRVLYKEKQKFAGTPMWLFDCQSDVGGASINYQIKYDVEKNTWILFKI